VLLRVAARCRVLQCAALCSRVVGMENTGLPRHFFLGGKALPKAISLIDVLLYLHK